MFWVRGSAGWIICCINNMKDKTITITGATGFLGSHIMAALLSKGCRVIILGRKSGAESIGSRISKILRWFSLTSHGSRIIFYETDFSRDNLGLTDEEYLKICRETDILVHAASDTSFSEHSRSRVFSANVDSLGKILKLASDAGVSFFHYISSAYGAGTDYRENPEIPFRSSGFTNVYEESKAAAEKKVTQFCMDFSMHYTLIRPSIVYGDSRTGRSLKFNALYYPVKSLMHIRDIYLNSINNSSSKNISAYGIAVDKNGILNLPIRLHLNTPGIINLIPVDFFTESVLSIMEKPETDGIYNITSGNPLPVETLIEYTQRFLGIKGIETVYRDKKEVMRNPAEELFDHFIKPYLPYLSDLRTFPASLFHSSSKGINPPELSYDVFERCMTFAVTAGWGKNLFTD